MVIILEKDMGKLLSKSVDDLESIAYDLDRNDPKEKEIKKRLRKVIVNLNEICEFYKL